MNELEKDYKMVTMIGLGIMIFFCSGLLWSLSAVLDCSEIKTGRSNCEDIKSIEKYLPIGMIIGIMMIGLSVVIFYPNNETNKEIRK